MSAEKKRKTTKYKTDLIQFGGWVILSAEMSPEEFSVLKLALKKYANGYGLSLLKRIEKRENN